MSGVLASSLQKPPSLDGCKDGGWKCFKLFTRAWHQGQAPERVAPRTTTGTGSMGQGLPGGEISPGAPRRVLPCALTAPAPPPQLRVPWGDKGQHIPSAQLGREG